MKLKTLKIFDWDLESIENMSRLFFNCKALTNIDFSNITLYCRFSLEEEEGIFAGTKKGLIDKFYNNVNFFYK